MTTQRALYAVAGIILFVLFASRMRDQDKNRDQRAGPPHPVQAAIPVSRALASEISPGNGPGFFENKGQAGSPQRVRYTLEANGVTCYFTPNQIVYAFSGNGNPGGKEVAASSSGRSPGVTQASFVTVSWKGANPHVRLRAEEVIQEVRNYYTTGHPKGITGIRGYRKIVYQELYPQIDLVLYLLDQQLKYDLVVKPGGQVSDIQLAYEGVQSLTLDSSGELLVEAPQGRLREGKPYTYQTVNGAKTEISSHYRVDGQHVRFEVGKYDPNASLIIDPTLLWATYYGMDNGESANAVYTDPLGNVYLAGSTTSFNLASFGGYDPNLNGISDAYLAKFDAAGNRLWATYYGGNAGEMGSAVCTDPSGNVYLAGYTDSSTDIAHDGHDNTFNESGGDGTRFRRDAFLVKFNAEGERVWGTYYGGENYAGAGPARREEANGVCSDANGNIFLTGFSTSTTGIAHNGYDTTYSGSADAFLVKFNNWGTRQWATYFGSTGEDVANAICADASGNIYIAGRTTSLDLGSFGGHDVVYGGDTDAFLAKFSNTGTFYYSTYYGGAGYDEALAVDTDGNDVYLAGETTSNTSISHQGHDGTYNGAQDAFLVKFNSLGARQWGTYYGGTGKEFNTAMSVSKNGDVYLAGTTESDAGIATPAGYETTRNGGWDGYLVRFSAAGVRQMGSYYGGPGHDYLGAVTTDGRARVYLAGHTQSSTGIAKNGFQNALNNANVGSIDAFLAKFDPYQTTDIPTGPGDVTGGPDPTHTRSTPSSVTAANGRLSAAPEGNAPEIQLHAYPNPVSTLLRVRIGPAADGPLRLEAYTTAGQRVYAGPMNGSAEAILDVSGWKKGIYVLKAHTSAGLITQKVVVQ